MKFPCPGCNKTLSVPDDAAGKKVKCPNCEERATVPSAVKAAAPAPPPAKPVTKPAARAEGAKERIAERPLARRAIDEDETERVKNVSRVPARKPRPAKEVAEGEGVLYMQLAGDDIGFEETLRKVLKSYLQCEQIDAELADWDDRAPDELQPNDILVHGAVTRADYGSQLIRYFVPILPLFGFGACKLAVDLDVEDGRGASKRFRSQAMRTIGVFGGGGNAMMRTNIKIVSHRTARAMARLVTRRSFLNRQAYTAALWALVLGLVGFIPMLGLLAGSIGVICGLTAFITIHKRGLPRRKGMAIAGIILSLLAFALSLAFLVLVLIDKH